MSESSLNAILIGLGGFVILILLLVIAALVITIIGRWKLFKKAGKEGWEAIIPFYSDYVLCEISGLEWYWFLALISTTVITFLSNINEGIENLYYLAYIAYIFANISVFYNLSKKLHKDSTFVVLAVLFTPIMICIAGFSKDYVYDKDIVVDKNGIIEKMVNKNNAQTNQNGQTYNQQSNVQQMNTNVELPQEKSDNNQNTNL